jgi:hypothetical protein
MPSSAWASAAARPPGLAYPCCGTHVSAPTGTEASAEPASTDALALAAASGSGDGDSAPAPTDADRRLASVARSTPESGLRIVIPPPPAGPSSPAGPLAPDGMRTPSVVLALLGAAPAAAVVSPAAKRRTVKELLTDAVRALTLTSSAGDSWSAGRLRGARLSAAGRGRAGGPRHPLGGSGIEPARQMRQQRRLSPIVLPMNTCVRRYSWVDAAQCGPGTLPVSSPQRRRGGRRPARIVDASRRHAACARSSPRWFAEMPSNGGRSPGRLDSVREPARLRSGSCAPRARPEVIEAGPPCRRQSLSVVGACWSQRDRYRRRRLRHCASTHDAGPRACRRFNAAELARPSVSRHPACATASNAHRTLRQDLTDG